MEPKIFKPVLGKKILLWFCMTLVGTALGMLLFWLDIRSLEDFWIVVLIAALTMGIYSFLFLNVPYFRVEVKGNLVEGPSLLGVGWRRVNFACTDLIPDQTGCKLGFLGFYVLHSRDAEKICAWGFDKAQLARLLRAVEDRKMNPVEESPFARVQRWGD